MEETIRDNTLGVVIVIAFDEKTDRIALTMNRTRKKPWHWTFLGRHIRPSDKGPEDASDDIATAKHAARSALRERAGLATVRIRFVAKEERAYGGPLYTFVALADFKELMVTARDAPVLVKDFSLEELTRTHISTVHRRAFNKVCAWLME